MADIRYVVLSDLHFGAANSALTSVVKGPNGAFQTGPGAPSPLLTAMLAGLRHLTADQPLPPTLVLAGDVLDLALSPDAVAAAAFEGFVDLAFGSTSRASGNRERIFAPTIYYLPGNHDHHLWEVAREAQYIGYLRELAPDRVPGPPWHTTGLLVGSLPPWRTSDLMSTLVQRRPGCADVTVRVMYPNMALTTSDSERCRIITHGHFTEAMYSLMSQLRKMVFPDSAAPATASIATIEEENFAWIDFFWSTLGRSGDVGADVGLVYAELSSPRDLNVLAGNLVRGMLQKSHAPAWLRPVEGALATAFVRNEVRHMARSERGTPDVTLSPAGRQGLRNYVEGPVLQQVRAELGRTPADVGFIFGHTHKPFVEDWALAGYRGPVRISNTGGWVVDTPGPAPMQGGVAVLLDDDLNTASLQFYRQAADGAPRPVQLLAPPDERGGGNPLQASLAARLDPTGEPWRTISSEAAEVIAQHHKLQASLLRRGPKTTA